MTSLAKINRVFTMEWSHATQHRMDIILWVAAESIIPLVSLAIWLAVAENSTSSPPPREVLTYYLIVLIIKLATDAWNGVFLAKEILNGKIITRLIRPIPFVWHDIANNVVEKILKSLIPVPIILLLIAAKPDIFSPAIYQTQNIILFLFSLALAITLAFTFDLIIGLLAFWLEDVFQLRRYKFLFESFASGLLIPFAFMPAFITNTVGLLPFRFIISAPAEILTREMTNLSVPAIIAMQASWTIITITVAVTLWRKGLKRYAPPGQ